MTSARPLPRLDLVDIPGQIRGESEWAWKFYNGRRLAWLPKSQCQFDPESQVMTIPRWLASKEGLL